MFRDHNTKKLASPELDTMGKEAVMNTWGNKEESVNTDLILGR